jgi:phosphoglycerate dehydrogenase-like enzyme
MRILATTRQPDDRFNRTWGIEVVPIEQLLRESDYVSLHTRLCDVTKGMIGADELALMKGSAMLINAARQELVDEQALVEAILAGRLAGAALDDPPVEGDSPLLTLRNVVFAPHLGNRAIEGMLAVLRLAMEQVVDVLNGRRPLHLLNPAVYARHSLRTSFDVEVSPDRS